ncbi:MAG TPA: hypothetical protein VF771_10695, partial [Longimicrobiaceae bacterium]
RYAEARDLPHRRRSTMEKLKLDLAGLRVESFAAEHAAGEGTVLAAGATPGHSCLRTACCPDTFDPGCTG